MDRPDRSGSVPDTLHPRNDKYVRLDSDEMVDGMVPDMKLGPMTISLPRWCKPANDSKQGLRPVKSITRGVEKLPHRSPVIALIEFDRVPDMKLMPK